MIAFLTGAISGLAGLVIGFKNPNFWWKFIAIIALMYLNFKAGISIGKYGDILL